MKTIAIIIPAYNEERNVPLIHQDLRNVLKTLEDTYTFDITFVNDGSSDSTWAAIESVVKADKHAHGISLSRNFGHQVAIEAGLDRADADAVIMMDCDGQHPAKLLPSMIEKWEHGALIVNTVRKDTIGASFFKKITATMFYGLINKFSETKIEPGSADFRLIDRKIVQVLKTLPEKVKFYRGLISWIGFEPVNIEYVAQERWNGASSYTLLKLYKLATDGLTGFSSFPLKFAKYIGLTTVSLRVIGLIAMLALDLLKHTYFPVWVYLIVLLFLMNGLQFVVLWFIGSYIGRIYNQQKDRPPYLIRDTLNV